MGGRLVSGAFSQWRPHLQHAPFLLLVFMASVARDDDNPPRYYGGAARLALALDAIRALPEAGERLPRAASSAVERHMRTLTTAGAVSRVRAPGPDHPAAYRLHLTAGETTERPPLNEGRHDATGKERPPLNEGRSPQDEPERPALSVSTPPAERGQRPPLSVSTPPAERGAKHHEHKRTPPTPALASVPAVTGDALAVVVVDQLGSRGANITRGVLAEALAPAAALGWTPETIREALATRGWHGAGPGAVIQWARGLGAPPAPQQRRAACSGPGCGSGTSGAGWLPDDPLTGRPVPCPCCKPHLVGAVSA